MISGNAFTKSLLNKIDYNIVKVKPFYLKSESPFVSYKEDNKGLQKGKIFMPISYIKGNAQVFISEFNKTMTANQYDLILTTKIN